MNRDFNGPYTPGVYSDGRACRIYGTRNGFAYLAFETDLTWVTKVPESLVEVHDVRSAL